MINRLKRIHNYVINNLLLVLLYLYTISTITHIHIKTHNTTPMWIEVSNIVTSLLFFLLVFYYILRILHNILKNHD